MREKILATDGHSALLRKGNVACIGYLHSGFSTEDENKNRLTQVLELDLHEDHRKDFFFFIDGTLTSHCINKSREDFMLKIYSELTDAKTCSLNNFLVVVTASFCAYMIGGETS